MHADIVKPVLAFLGQSGDRADGNRFALLAAISRRGSISAAASDCRLSYRAAWDAVNALNNLFPLPLVEAQAGGRHGGSAVVTEEGTKVLAAHRFLTGKLEAIVAELQASLLADPDGSATPTSLLWSYGMKTSARNTYYGVVSGIIAGVVNAEVDIRVSETTTLTAVITNKSAIRLGIHPGSEVFALVKASAPILMPESETLRTSARNRLSGTVVSVESGEVNTEIVLDLGDGKTLAAVITTESAGSLGFRPGERAVALIKASQIIIGVD